MKVKDSKFIIIKIGEQNLSLAFEALFKLILILIKKYWYLIEKR
jgi:hypothetical protein